MHTVIALVVVGLALVYAVLAVAALRTGWMLPWLRGRNSPRTWGLVCLGLAMFLPMAVSSNLLPVSDDTATRIQELAVVPLLGCAAVAGALAWRDRRTSRVVTSGSSSRSPRQ